MRTIHSANQYLRSSVELMFGLFWKDARARIYWSEYVHFRRKRKTITTAGSARGWILGKKFAQHTRSRGKLLARTLKQVRNDDSRRTTSHRKRKSRTRQNSLERNALQNMVRMWTMDLGILLRHAESTSYHGPVQILMQNLDFQEHRDWSCSWCPRYLSSQRSWNRDSYPSTVRDNTKVWVVISRSRNRYVGELRHRESDKIHEQVVGECVQCQDEEHSQGERSEARQNFGWCRDRPWRARRWLCCRRGIHRTRIVSLANDCCKSDGCCCEITRMRWTSRRRSISLHPSKNGGRSKVVLNSKVWMSRYMDTSSTTQVAQILLRQCRPSGSSWTNFVRSPACWLLVERHFEEVLLGLGWEKVPNCECLFVHRKQGLFLSVYVDDIKMAGRTEYGSNVEEIDGTCWSWRTNIMSRSCIFGMHSTWM